VFAQRHEIVHVDEWRPILMEPLLPKTFMDYVLVILSLATGSSGLSTCKWRIGVGALRE